MGNFKYESFLSNWLNTSQCSRLTPEDEKDLPEKIQRAEILKKSLKKESREPTAEETEVINDGKFAFEKFVESNLPLCIHFAKKYASHYPGTSLTVDDLTQEAALGIIRAAKRYDPTRSCKFSTYASYWIEQSIRRAIEDKGDLIRKPASAHSRARKVHKIDARFQERLDSKSVSDLTGLSTEEVDFIRQLDNTKITSIDQNFFSDEDSEQYFHESIADETNVPNDVLKSLERETFLKIVDCLVPDTLNKVIIKLKYGCFQKGISLSCSEISIIIKEQKSPAQIEELIKNFERDTYFFSAAVKKASDTFGP